MNRIRTIAPLMTIMAVALAICLSAFPGRAFAQEEPAPPAPEEDALPPPPPDDELDAPLPPPADQEPPEPPPDEPEAIDQPPAEPEEPDQLPGDEDDFPPEAPAEPELPPQPAADASNGIVLNFKDATLDAVLEYLSEAAGFVVVKDAAVMGRVTVISQQPINAEEAIGLLNTILKDKGYMAVRTGRTLKVATLTDAKKANLPVRSGSDPEAIVPSDAFVTQVIPLRFIDAAKLKQDIATLIPAYADLSANAGSNSLILTDTEANIRRIVEIVKALDSRPSTVADIKVFQLQYANATTVAKLINDVFKQDTTTQQQASPFEAFRRFRGPGGEQSSSSTDDSGRKEKVTASADDRTNTVVVSASTETLKVIEGMVRELDSNPSAEEDVFVYRLKNAKAANLVRVLNDLFTARSTTGTSGSSTRGQSTQGRSGFFTRTQQQQTSAATTQAATDLAGQVYFVADEDTNSIMVMTAAKNFDRIRDIIDEMDRSVPQVLIKVLLAEVTRTNSKDLGVEFSALNLRASGRGSQVFSDFGVAAGTDGLIYKLVEKDVTAALRALETVGKLDVLSRPYILASDNQAASITVGHRVPFIQNSRTTDTGQTINTIQYENIGIILNVTPHINPAGLVILDVAPEISALTGDTVPISDTVDAPVYANRSATSRVAINNGQTIVIGGLMEDKKTENVRRVPLLGSIPVLGALFRRTVTDLTKTELLIFLTPHVAQQPATLEDMSADEMSGSKVVPNAVAPGTFDEHMEGLQRGATQGEEAE